ncbi:MAG: hypothetical protein DHS20C12_28220 [Pseudohongiella sp.]|nr:MAG: hypothetical protein DHS20C12_28220 [Pseudohongiella sp.]
MSQNDSENMRETISALLDNEADDLELRRFLKACEQDPTLLESWERYSLAQSVLHEAAQPVSSSLSQRISAQLEQEAPLTAAAVAPTQSSWKDAVTKMAIAASVAAVFLVTVQVNLDSGSSTNLAPALAEQTTETVESPVSATLVQATFLAESDAATAAQLDTRNLEHYIETLTLDDEEPVIVEHMQDSPLFRLVNEMQENP